MFPWWELVKCPGSTRSTPWASLWHRRHDFEIPQHRASAQTVPSPLQRPPPVVPCAPCRFNLLPMGGGKRHPIPSVRARSTSFRPFGALRPATRSGEFRSGHCLLFPIDLGFRRHPRYRNRDRYRPASVDKRRICPNECLLRREFPRCAMPRRMVRYRKKQRLNVQVVPRIQRGRVPANGPVTSRSALISKNLQNFSSIIYDWLRQRDWFHCLGSDLWVRLSRLHETAPLLLQDSVRYG